MKRSLASVAALALTVAGAPVARGDNVFPNGSTDIAALYPSTRGWGQYMDDGNGNPTDQVTDLLAASCVFREDNRTFTCSQDVSFHLFFLECMNPVFDFGGHTVTVTGSDGDDAWGFENMSPSCNGSHAVFKNGSMMITNSFGSGSHGWPSGECHNTQTTLEHFNLTCLGDIAVGRLSSDGHVLILTNGTSCSADNVRVSLDLPSYGCFNCLEVTEGCTLSAINLYTDSKGLDVPAVQPAGNSVVVRGADAKATIRDAIVVGFKTEDNSMLVTEGATLETPPYVEGIGSPSYKRLLVGYSGARTTFAVSNATLNCEEISECVIGLTYASSNCVMRLMGADSHVTFGRMDPGFGRGNHGLLEVLDGLKFENSNGTQYEGFVGTCGNVFRMSGAGTEWRIPNRRILFGNNAGDSEAVVGADNRIEVLDGAVYEVQRVLNGGERNGIVISNALMIVNHQFNANGFILGDTNSGETTLPTNNFLVLAGSSPKLRFSYSTTGVQTWYGSHIKYVLPAVSYADPPIVGHYLCMDETCDLDFDLSNLPKKHGSIRYTLARVKSRDELNAAVLERANRRLDGIAELVWKECANCDETGFDLVLDVKSTLGMTMVVR